MPKIDKKSRQRDESFVGQQEGLKLKKHFGGIFWP
jgi:hypothetical protein